MDVEFCCYRVIVCIGLLNSYPWNHKSLMVIKLIIKIYMIGSRQWIGMWLYLSGTLAENPIGPKGCFCSMNDVSCLVKP